MPDALPQEKPNDPGTERASDATRDLGKAPDGAHLTRRIDRNSALTEQAQNDAGGGAHSGTPDPTNP